MRMMSCIVEDFHKIR